MAVATGTRLSEQDKVRLREIAADPVRFAREILGMNPYDKQEEILRKATKGPRLSVVGANGVGKDWTIGGILIPWWFAQHKQAVVVVIGPTHRQVHDVVWRELKAAINGSRIPIGGQMFETDKWEIGEKTYAVGLATDNSQNILGYHSPHLLAICSEAHNLPDGHFESVDKLNYELLVYSGNPFSMGGPFYESHHGKRHLWETVQISAFDSPNVKAGKVVVPGVVTLQDIESRKEQYGESNPYYIATVLGEWPKTLTDSCIPLSEIMASTVRKLEPGTPEVLALDVAWSGADKTVAVHRRGPVCEIVHRVQGDNVMASVGWVANYMAEHRNIDTVIVDAVSGGTGVVGRLREKGIAVVPFYGGAKPWGVEAGKKWANRNTEAWMNMAGAFRAGTISIPNDRALLSQLAVRKNEYTSNGIRVESKAEMRPPPNMGRASWQSPDEADALMMCWAGTGSKGAVKVYNVARTI